MNTKQIVGEKMTDYTKMSNAELDKAAKEITRRAELKALEWQRQAVERYRVAEAPVREKYIDDLQSLLSSAMDPQERWDAVVELVGAYQNEVGRIW
jgi:hypothetical protein